MACAPRGNVESGRGCSTAPPPRSEPSQNPSLARTERRRGKVDDVLDFSSLFPQFSLNFSSTFPQLFLNPQFFLNFASLFPQISSNLNREAKFSHEDFLNFSSIFPQLFLTPSIFPRFSLNFSSTFPRRCSPCTRHTLGTSLAVSSRVSCTVGWRCGSLLLGGFQ